MTHFSKKQSIIFMGISFSILILGTFLVCFSSSFIPSAYDFFSQKVFHRSFDLEKWLPTIESFFIIPVFMAIVFQSVFFLKFRDKDKIVILSVYFCAVLFATLYSIAVATNQHVDADLASEILLAKECVRERTFWPRGWNYSTEIRLFNTNLITAPAFLFTSDWNVAKLITSFGSMAVLFFAVYYVVCQLRIKEFWIKYLVCILSVLPFSSIAWNVGAWGTYYIPHAVFNLVYIGTFIKLMTNRDLRHPKAWLIFFYAWAFVSGLSSIRYIMIFVFPLAFAMTAVECLKKNPDGMIRILDGHVKIFPPQSVRHSVLGLLFSGLGYVCNNAVLQPLFQFSQWNDTAFCTLGDITLTDILHALLSFFGYQDNIAVLTPGGIINILVYVFLLLFVLLVVFALKNKFSEEKKILLLYFAASYLFNTFVYLHTELIYRYYYPILVVAFPCVALLLSDEKISFLKRYALGCVLAVMALSSSFLTLQHNINTDTNKGLYKVAEFLDKNYTFGYGSFGNANVITYLTNGDVEVGNLYKRKSNGKEYFTDVYKYDKWLTPNRYYADERRGEHIFLLVSQEQLADNESHPVIKAGRKVYGDEYYVVFDYDSHEAFKDSFVP